MPQKSKQIQSESLNPPKKIAICGCGSPLIWTFAFAHAEYWCPDCRSTFGMMGVKKAELTPELKFQHIINMASSSKYLHAKSVFTCDAMRIKGVYTKRQDFPESMLKRAKKIIHEFESR